MATLADIPPYFRPGSLFDRKLGPYTGVQFLHERIFDTEAPARKPWFGGGRFTIFTYQAYNAGGLIGSEHNGLAVLHVDVGSILVDRLAKEASGYNGVSPAQYNLWVHLAFLATWPQAVEIFNQCSHKRITFAP